MRADSCAFGSTTLRIRNGGRRLVDVDVGGSMSVISHMLPSAATQGIVRLRHLHSAG